VAQKIQEATIASTAVVQKVPNITDPEMRSKAEDSVNKSINALYKAAPKAPGESIQGLTQIGTAAYSAGDLPAWTDAVQSLRKIKNDQISPQSAQQAEQSLNTVLATSPNATPQ
jgi:hypothetical protein